MLIEAVDPHADEVIAMLTTYVGEVRAAVGDRDTQTTSLALAQDDYLAPNGTFLVVRLDAGGHGVGCAGVRLLDPRTAEVKRMWLDPQLRGRGVGRALLTAVEQAARDLGASRGVLDTRVELESARRLYAAAGWQEVAPYNDNPDATHWYAKDLTTRAAEETTRRPRTS